MNSVEAKVERAKEHFAQVQYEIDAWVGGDPFSATYEQNEEGSQHCLRAKLIGDRPPVDKWALLFGDGITNLRDALDHLVYQISNTDVEHPSHPKAAFVIVRQQSSFSAEAKGKLANISQATRATIESFQPYNRPHPQVAPSLLWVLSAFAVTNKHKLLLPVFAVASSLGMNFTTKGPSSGHIAQTRGSIDDGSIFFVYQTHKPEPETILTFNKLKIDIALVHESQPSVPDHLSGRSPTRLLVPALIQEVVETIKAVRASL